MNEQTIRFRFGIFVLASLILLAAMTILFGGFPSFFRRTENYTIVFTNAQGIVQGTPVRRSGVNIGEVRAVSLDNTTGKVEVEIRVDQKYTLRKGDRPTIMMGLIGGDSAISFVPPENAKNINTEPVEPGSVLVGVSPLDAGSLLKKTSDLVQPAEDTLNEIRKVFTRLDKMLPVLEETLVDFREVSKMAKQVGPELQKTSQEIGALAKSARESIPDLKSTNEEIKIAAHNVGKVGERLDVLLRTNEDKIVKSLNRADEVLRRLNDVLSDENQKNVRDTLRNVKNGTQQLEAISNNMNELIKDGRGTIKKLNGTLSKADEAFIDLQNVMKPLGEKGPVLIDNLGASADSLNKTLKDLREIIQVVGRSDGTVQKLLTDPSLYNNLNDSAQMVTRILPRVDQIMRDLETFADKLARHPELLGIPGVIRPSSGLKDAPTPPYRVYPIH